MKSSKSDPKLRYSLKKIDGFFSKRNLDMPMYMDERNTQNSEISKQQLKSYGTLPTPPRTKLSYSLNEKVGAALSDSRKMGIIQKDSHTAIKNSLVKISLVSALPPIKTEVHEVQVYLRKLKNQFNQVTQKTMKLTKESSNMKASTNQIIEKAKVMETILKRTCQKQQEKVDEKSKQNEIIKHNHEVLKHMHQQLKTNIRMISKYKNQLQQQLKQHRLQIQNLNTTLHNLTANLNKNIFTKTEFERNQELESDAIMIKSNIAQLKLQHQWKAEKIKSRLALIVDYEEEDYHWEFNIQQHVQLLEDLNAQKGLGKILAAVYLKHQGRLSGNEKAYALMKMHANVNQHPEFVIALQKNNQKVSRQSTVLTNKNSSIVSISQPSQTVLEFDLVSAYNSTFSDKEEINQKIVVNEREVKRLEGIKKQLWDKFVGVVMEDKVTEGKKPQKNKVNYEKETKKLMVRNQRADNLQMMEKQLQAWVERQQNRLNLKFSKKLGTIERINSIIAEVVKQSKQVKIVKIKQNPVVIEQKNEIINKMDTKDTKDTKDIRERRQRRERRESYQWDVKNKTGKMEKSLSLRKYSYI